MGTLPFRVGKYGEMRNKDSAEKKESSGRTVGTSLSLKPEEVECLKQMAKENGLTMTGYVRNHIQNYMKGKPEYADDVEIWIGMHAKKMGVKRQTVIERVLVVAMKNEQRTGKDVI